MLKRWLALVLLVSCATPKTEPPPPPPAPPPPTAVAPVEPPKPPVAKKVPVVRQLHGEKFVDDYYWLREKGTADVNAYLKAEDTYATATMDKFKWLEDDLFQKIVSHVAEDDETVPVKDGDYEYWSRVEKGKNYWTHLRRKVGTVEAQVILDVNALAEGKPFLELGEMETSDDGRWLAYSTDETGFRQYTLRFKDLQSGAISPESIPRVVVATFAKDNATVFYVVEDEAKRPYRVYLHTVGTDPKGDDLVYEEKDGRFEAFLWRTLSGDFIVIDSESKLQNEIRLIDAAKPEAKPRLIRARSGEIKYYPEHRKDQLIIRVNDKGKNYRIVSAPVRNPNPGSWKQMRPHDPKVMIEDLVVFNGQMVMSVRENGLPHVEVQSFSNRTIARIKVPEADYDVYLARSQNREFDSNKIRYTYESLSTPKTLYEMDVATNAVTQLKQDPVPGGFDRTSYTTERISAKAKDGTPIPISVVYKNGVAKDGTAPLHLTAYGSYGFPYSSNFSPARLALLDRGVVLAIAHIRGGGELGKVWHEQGRLAKKMNTFTDFITCAEHLIAEKYGSKDRLTIEGKSAGGLLIGAVTNMRPDLFKAAVANVPFVDVINTMNDPSLPLTITEYEEWGNPTIAEQYKWMRAYSPYDNIEPKAYPAMLVKTSVNDSQVMYWEPAKYVARLRAMKTDQNPLLFKVYLDEAGHSGKSGRYDKYRDTAFDYAFILWQLGVVQ